MSLEQTGRGYHNVEDPYQLERLAEELASRETNGQLQSSTSDNIDALSASLPDYGPLSHHNPLLTGNVFNVEEFLISRARATLPELRAELRDYLSNLKEELVQLINNDYEAFISLSTDLRSEGSKLKRMRSPLGDLRARVLVSECPSLCGLYSRITRNQGRSYNPYRTIYKKNSTNVLG